jgi:hypothetical protein
MVTNSDDKALYANLAGQWREIADQAEELEVRRLALLRRLSTLSISPHILGAATSVTR